MQSLPPKQTRDIVWSVHATSKICPDQKKGTKPKRTLETQQDAKAPSNLTPSPELGEGLVWSCPCREGLRLEQQQAAAAGKPVAPGAQTPRIIAPTLATRKGHSTSARLLLTSPSRQFPILSWSHRTGSGRPPHRRFTHRAATWLTKGCLPP